MSGGARLRATAGGSVTMVADDTLTTDEEFNVSDGGIESGSNANGSYTKFPDGTLICWSYVGGGEVNGTSKLFPMNFAAYPVMSGNSITTIPRIITFGSRSATGFTAYKFSDYSGGKSTVPYNWTAIGRWK